MRKFFLWMVVMVSSVVLFAASQVQAHNPTGVPVTTPAPLQCTTPGGGWTITAVSGLSGEFPVEVNCTLAAHDGQRCFLYKYSITDNGGGTPSHVLVSISADHDLDSAAPTAAVTPPGTASGDSTTGFLAYAQHEYPVRVNATPAVPGEIVVVGPSSPRISTILVHKGKILESCLIAGPGVLGGQFTAVALAQDQLVAGGQCVAHLEYDVAGNVIEVTTDSPCSVNTDPVFINGAPLRDNRSPTGITHGNGTCTTYGPPVPSPARSVCR